MLLDRTGRRPAILSRGMGSSLDADVAALVPKLSAFFVPAQTAREVAGVEPPEPPPMGAPGFEPGTPAV